MLWEVQHRARCLDLVSGLVVLNQPGYNVLIKSNFVQKCTITEISTGKSDVKPQRCEAEYSLRLIFLSRTPTTFSAFRCLQSVFVSPSMKNASL